MTRLSTPKIALLAAAALAAEQTLLEDLAWHGGRLELLLLIAGFAALFARDRRQALLCCWIVGLTKDAGSVGPMGLHALLFLGVGWAFTALRSAVFRDSVLTQAGLVAAATAAVGLASATAVSLTAGAIPAGVWLGRILVSTLVTAGLAPVVIHALALPARVLVNE